MAGLHECRWVHMTNWCMADRTSDTNLTFACSRTARIVLTYFEPAAEAQLRPS